VWKILRAGPPKPCRRCRRLSIFWSPRTFTPTAGQVQCYPAQVCARIAGFVGLAQWYPSRVQRDLGRSVFEGASESQPSKMASPDPSSQQECSPPGASHHCCRLIWSGADLEIAATRPLTRVCPLSSTSSLMELQHDAVLGGDVVELRGD
jgi:hypothetical protein